MAVMSAHAAENFPSLACLILNGGLELHPAVAKLVDGSTSGCRSSPPRRYLRHGAGGGQGPRAVTATSIRKIDTALALMETHVDTADLLAQLAIPIPEVITPQMFTYQLQDRARSHRRRIVLPEGDDDRILKAAGRLLAHRWPTSPSSATKARCGPEPPSWASTSTVPS